MDYSWYVYWLEFSSTTMGKRSSTKNYGYVQIMKTFKQFTTNGSGYSEQELLGHCSAGGPPNQKLITTTTTSKKDTPTGFCSAGGPREHKLVETKESYDDSNILRDPAADNTVTDHTANDHKRFVTPPKYRGYERTYPHLTDEQAKQYQALANNTQHNHPHYQYAVSNYTNGSYELNSHLYESHVNNTPHDPIVQDLVVKHLDDLIAQHRTPHPMTVYTGPHFNPHEHAGKRVHLPAFTSASLSPHVAKDFGVGNHVLRIHLPEGHPHLFMDHESTYQGQAEVVLPRNTTLRIADKPSHSVSGVHNDHFEDRNPSQHQSTTHFWDAHVVEK